MVSVQVVFKGSRVLIDCSLFHFQTCCVISMPGRPIVEDPGTVEVLTGDNVTLKCSVIAHPPATMTWSYQVSLHRQLYL